MPAMQQMLMASGASGAPSVPVVKSFISSGSFAFASSPITVTGFNIGAANPTKLVVAAVSWVNATSPSALNSATIGGVAATIIGQKGGSAASDGISCALISAVVPVSTTANVVLNFAAAAQGEVSVWTITGLLSATPVATVAAVQPIAGATFSGTILTQDGGVLICGVGAGSAATSYSTTGVSVDDQGAILATGGVNFRYLAASQNIGAGAGSPTYPFSVTRVGGAGSAWTGGVIAASFR